MDKRWLRVALKALDEVRVRFPDTKQFLEGFIEQECLKGNMSANEVIFLQA